MKILVVDDHADTRVVVGMILDLLGHASDSAEDAVEAFAKAVACPFDVLIVDVYMPIVGGWKVIEILRERGFLPAKVISMSAGRGKEAAALSSAHGCHAHLRKPFKIEEIESALAA